MSNKKLWQVGEGGNELISKYTVGDDYILDQHLLEFDLAASRAHASMLQKMGVLTDAELADAMTAFKQIDQSLEQGTFKILPEQEDCHTAIEQFITEKFGDVGKKIHTGRSRNDQSLVALRLLMIARLKQSLVLIDDLSAAFDAKAAEFPDLPMPGYTHMQKAMPTTVSTWLGGFKDALNDNKQIITAALAVLDQNPLGSASGFGIKNFKADSNFTAKELGFSKVQNNPIHAGLSRGTFELITLNALQAVMSISGRFAADMLLFSTQEFSYFSLPDEFTTGSSIMPQKRNYDVFEIMRARSSVFNAYQAQIAGIMSGIPSGYNRDSQLTKKPLINGLADAIQTLEALVLCVQNLQVNKDSLEAAMTEDLFVTEKVYELVNDGMPFREAYIKVKEGLKK